MAGLDQLDAQHRWGLEGVRRELLHPLTLALVAVPAPSPLDLAAFLLARRVPPPAGPHDHLYITRLFTHPAHRRRGAATLLMTHLLELARREGYGGCALDCSPKNLPAAVLYASLGFRWAAPAKEVMLLRLTPP